MSSPISQDRPDPHDHSYYAPRWLRQPAGSPPTRSPDEKPERLDAAAPRHDALFEEAVAEALRHPLDPEMIPEPPSFAYERERRSAIFGIAGRFAAAIGVSAIVALFFVFMVPTSQARVATADNAISSLSGLVKSLRTALLPAPQKRDSSEPVFSEYRTIPASDRSGQSAATPEESEALLQKFVQWQQKPASAPIPRNIR